MVCDTPALLTSMERSSRAHTLATASTPESVPRSATRGQTALVGRSNHQGENMESDGLALPERYTFRGHSIAWGSIGEGPPAVLIHGWPFSTLVWRRIAPILAQDRKIFYFDLLGFGAS